MSIIVCFLTRAFTALHDYPRWFHLATVPYYTRTNRTSTSDNLYSILVSYVYTDKTSCMHFDPKFCIRLVRARVLQPISNAIKRIRKRYSHKKPRFYRGFLLSKGRFFKVPICRYKIAFFPLRIDLNSRTKKYQYKIGR